MLKRTSVSVFVLNILMFQNCSMRGFSSSDEAQIKEVTSIGTSLLTRRTSSIDASDPKKDLTSSNPTGSRSNNTSTGTSTQTGSNTKVELGPSRIEFIGAFPNNQIKIFIGAKNDRKVHLCIDFNELVNGRALGCTARPMESEMTQFRSQFRLLSPSSSNVDEEMTFTTPTMANFQGLKGGHFNVVIYVEETDRLKGGWIVLQPSIFGHQFHDSFWLTNNSWHGGSGGYQSVSLEKVKFKRQFGTEIKTYYDSYRSWGNSDQGNLFETQCWSKVDARRPGELFFNQADLGPFIPAPPVGSGFRTALQNVGRQEYVHPTDGLKVEFDCGFRVTWNYCLTKPLESMRCLKDQSVSNYGQFEKYGLIDGFPTSSQRGLPYWRLFHQE